jgi:hypothetical protein
MISPKNFRKTPHPLCFDKEQLKSDLDKLIPTIEFMKIRDLRTQAKYIQKFQKKGIKDVQPVLNYGVAVKKLVKSAYGEYDVMGRIDYRCR